MGFVSYVREEIDVIKERDPAIKSTMEVFLYPTFHAILKYRITCSEELVGSPLMASPAMVNLMSPPESEMSMIRWVTTMFSRVTGFL